MSWSRCSKACGGGTQSQSRHCDSPAPANGGDDCKGEPLRQRSCSNNQCKLMEFIDGQWGGWKTSGQCSRSCGGGSQYQYRRCDSPPPVSGGEYCKGEHSQTKSCNSHRCKLIRLLIEIMFTKYHTCEKY